MFTGLKADTNYTFYQRVAEISSSYASSSSSGLKVITNPKETLVKENGIWCYTVNDKKTNATTLVKYGSKWYYVQNGIVNFKANTKVKYNGKWYTVRNGIVK